MRQNSEASYDRWLQVSARHNDTEQKWQEQQSPKEYQSWQILPGKIKTPPNVNLKLFQEYWLKKQKRLQRNAQILTLSQQQAKDEALENQKQNFSSLNIINVNSYTKLAHQNNTLDQFKGRQQTRSYSQFPQQRLQQTEQKLPPLNLGLNLTKIRLNSEIKSCEKFEQSSVETNHQEKIQDYMSRQETMKLKKRKSTLVADQSSHHTKSSNTQSSSRVKKCDTRQSSVEYFKQIQQVAFNSSAQSVAQLRQHNKSESPPSSVVKRGPVFDNDNLASITQHLKTVVRLNGARNQTDRDLHSREQHATEKGNQNLSKQPKEISGDMKLLPEMPPTKERLMDMLKRHQSDAAQIVLFRQLSDQANRGFIGSTRRKVKPINKSTQNVRTSHRSSKNLRKPVLNQDSKSPQIQSRQKGSNPVTMNNLYKNGAGNGLNSLKDSPTKLRILCSNCDKYVHFIAKTRDISSF